MESDYHHRRHARHRKPIDLQDSLRYGFQASINTERALVQVEEEEEARSRLLMIELIVLLLCLAAWVYLEIQRVKEVHASLYAWLQSTGWSTCSPLSIILSIEWKWYNLLLGCGSDKNFANAVFLAWYNKIIQPRLVQAGANGLQTLYATSIQLAGSNKSAMELICSAFQVRSTDPLAKLCYQPCPNPASGQGNSAMNYIQGAMGGMGSGAGVGMLLHSMEAGPVAAVGAIGVGIGLGLLSASQQNSAEAANVRNACANEQASTSCWLPPGYCPSA